MCIGRAHEPESELIKMVTRYGDEHVLPRPVVQLPEYALSRARANAAEKLVEAFGLSPEAATAIADACVDPAELRRSIDHPIVMAVTGGIIKVLRADVWSRRVLPDPRNPRVGPKRRHPFAVEPGLGDEMSRFAPLAEAMNATTRPELHVQAESREHLTWASAQAKAHVLDVNDWRLSIRLQGVMSAVWLVATQYAYADEAPPLWVVTAAEGSSRMTAVHDILGISSVDSVYDANDRFMRTNIKRLNDLRERGNATPKQLEQIRCERVPAEIIIAFEPYDGTTSDFATAVKSLVALRHVDAPKEWGDGPENESLADGCLSELERRGHLTALRRRWLAGGISRPQAEANRLSADPSIRAADIVRTFTHLDPNHRVAVRVAITAQSTRKRVKSKLLIRLAAALIVRGIPSEHRVDQIRRYLEGGYGELVREGEWSATARSVDDLLAAALIEHGEDVDPATSALGPNRLELAARAALPLIAKQCLFGDRGSTNNSQPDRRDPGHVIEAMAREARGLHQLHRALSDFAAQHPVRAVNETGQILRKTDGQEHLVSDRYLRETFAPAGQVVAPSEIVVPADQLHAALAAFGRTVTELVATKDEVVAVRGTDDDALVDREGVSTMHTEEWRRRLREVDDTIVDWASTHKRKHRTIGTTPSHVERSTRRAEDLNDPDDECDEHILDDGKRA